MSFVTRFQLSTMSSMGKRIFLVICLIFLSLARVFAQWSGTVRADGAWNLERSNTENADLKLKYAGSKFQAGSDIHFGHSFMPSSQMTSILDAKKEQDEFYKGESKDMNPRKFNASAKFDFEYTFDSRNRLDALLSYGFNGGEENSLLNTERYNYGRSPLFQDHLQQFGSLCRNKGHSGQVYLRRNLEC